MALALGPTTTADEPARTVGLARELCGPTMPFTLSVVGIGVLMPAWLGRDGLTPDGIRDGGGIGVLDADPDRAAEALLTYEDRHGIDEVTVPGELAEAFAPALARLPRLTRR